MKEEYDLKEFAPWLVVFITLAGYALRVLLLDSKGMWMDETFSLWMSNHSLAGILQWSSRLDLHPPLYYLLLHGWITQIGDTPYDVRQLSALFGAATIPVIYLIGKRLSGTAVGVAAAVLLAVSPFNIRYAQETRMYTLLMFNVAVAMYALVRLLTDPSSARPIGSQFRMVFHALRTSRPVEPDAQREPNDQDLYRNSTGWRAWVFSHRWLHIRAMKTDLTWVAFIVFSAATLLSHNSAVLFLVATNLFVLGLMVFRRRQKPESRSFFRAPSFRNWILAQVGILILWSPWFVPFIRQSASVYQNFWVPKPGWGTLIGTLGSFLNEAVTGQAGTPPVTWALYGLVLGLGLVHYRKNPSNALFLVALFAVPFLGELIVSLRRPIFLDRTLIWTTIPLFLALAVGIAQFRFRFLIVLVLGIFTTINLLSTVEYFRWAYKEDWSKPAGYVAYSIKSGDLILFNAAKVQIPFDYYFVPFEKKYLLQVEKHGVPVDLSLSSGLEPKMSESDIPGLISLLSGHKRVWLVYDYAESTDPTGIVPQTLASQMKLLQQCNDCGMQVQLYEAP